MIVGNGASKVNIYVTLSQGNSALYWAGGIQHMTDLTSGQYLEGLSRSTSNAGWQKAMPGGDPRGRTVQV